MDLSLANKNFDKKRNNVISCRWYVGVDLGQKVKHMSRSVRSLLL